LAIKHYQCSATVTLNAAKVGKDVCAPHKPILSQYARLPTSVTPVAEQYTTLAFGSEFCIAITACDTLVLDSSFAALKFLALCASSNSKHPSNDSPPHQSIICCNLVRLLAPEPVRTQRTA
jgi:hypothetical protein